MKILAFDTSNNTASVAISDGENILSYIEDLRPSVQAERLLPMIEEALKATNLTYNQLNYLGVTNGPGSFTGIRIGLAAAKGILMGTKITGTSISNFEIAYYRAKVQVKEYDRIIIFLNAYRDQLYVQIFDKKAKASLPLLIHTKEAGDLINRQEGIIVCSGNGLEFIYQEVKQSSNLMLLPRFSRIKALHLCRYINSTLESRQSKPIEPMYIKPPDAKLNSNNLFTRRKT